MLTKDLLRYRFRAEKVMPTLIDPKSEELLGMAQTIVDAFTNAQGLEQGELEEQLEELGLPASPIKAGLEKLSLDRCEFAENDGAAEERRWEVFTAAERMRREGSFATHQVYAESVALEVGTNLQDLQNSLYSDLPEHRKLKAFKSISPEMLLHRLNCAQVQGLLLRSTWITISSKNVTIEAKRKFFRALKFHQLLSLVSDHGDDGAIHISLSGPLSIFQEAQVYGNRVANFFPHVLHLANWHLRAELTIDGKKVELSLSEKCGIKSHYENSGGYIPPELLICLDTFNEKYGDWHAEPGKSFIHLGQQSYCFPDITVKQKSTNNEVHFELFHRWHAGQLENRLKVLEESDIMNLRIGVCRSLTKSAEVKIFLENCRFFTKSGFVFKDFPTSEHLWKTLSAN